MKCKAAAVGRRVWEAGRRHALTVFDLGLQGALLAVLLLETNVYLLLRRGAITSPGTAFLEDYIVMVAGAVEFFLAAAVSWVGRRRRQYALAISFTITSLSALVVFAFPFNDKQLQTNVGLCSGKPIALSQYTVDDIAEDDDNIIDHNFMPRTIVLLVTAILCAISKLCIWVHGLTYLDDHQPQNGPFYYGILISIRLSLGLSAASWLRTVSLSAAWWRCLLPLSLLPLLFAAVFTFFPAALHDQLPQLRQSEFKETFGRIIKNKFVMLLTIAIALLQLALLSITQYDSAYIQGRFHMEAFHRSPMTSRASDIFRPLVILFFIMIFRVRFSVRRVDGVKAGTAARVGGAVSLAAAALCVALAAASCPTVRRAALQPVCSQHCACASGRHEFTPVCGLDTLETYFSPCDAGCEHYEDLNGFILFQNCTCGLQRAVRGSCSLSDCNLAYSVYQVLYTVLVAVAGSGLLMQGMAVLRSVKPSDKTLGLGVSFAIIALINNVLGRLLYMLISLSCCAVWSEGACVLHAASVWRVPAVSAALAALSAAISFAASQLDTAIS